MGRDLFRRKNIILLLFCFWGTHLLMGEQDRAPEQAVFSVHSLKKDRGAERVVFVPQSLDLASIRQSHQGPEVISSVFTEDVSVEENYRRILNSPEDQFRIRFALERGKPYASFIRKKIHEYGLPPELFYLPVVESLYNPFARSPQGALGIWQFMADSMHPWMVRNEWVDERRDFWKSTIGALEKLKLNHQHTQDWLLALAAYNCGLNRVLSVTRSNPGKDFWALSREKLLPRETRAYVPRFLAVARFASYQGRRGQPLDWEGGIEWVQIQLPHSVDLRLLAKTADVPLELLMTGNRELLFSITPPQNYTLKVPLPHKERVEAALREKKQLLEFVVHTVKAGDTLYDLARHFGPPLSMILEYNPSIRPETLQIGAKLLIPKLKDVGPYKNSYLPPLEDPQTSVPFTNLYVVRPGDSLWSIARNYGTTVERLARENRINPQDPIHPGTELKVP